MGRLTFYLVCGLVFMVPFEMLGYLEYLPSVMRMLGLATLACACLAVISGHPLRGLSVAMMLRVLLVVFAVLSFAWTMIPEITRDVDIRILLLTIFALLIWEFVRTENQQILMLRSFVAGMLIPIAMQFGGFFGVLNMEIDPETARYTGGGQDLNYLAMMYSASVLMAVYLATNNSKFDRFIRWGYYGFAVVAAVGMGLTGSRAGTPCLFIAIVFSALVFGISVKRVLTFVTVFAIGAAAFTLVPAALKNRLTELNWGADTLVVREEIWKRDLAGYMQQPITGVGEGAIPLVAAQLTGARPSPPHNTLLSILYELGPFALLAFIAFIALLYWAAWKMPWRESMLWLGTLSIWFLGSMSAGSQIDKFGWFIQAALMTQAAASSKRRAIEGRKSEYKRGTPIASGPLNARLGQ